MKGKTPKLAKIIKSFAAVSALAIFGPGCQTAKPATSEVKVDDSPEREGALFGGYTQYELLGSWFHNWDIEGTIEDDRTGNTPPKWEQAERVPAWHMAAEYKSAGVENIDKYIK